MDAIRLIAIVAFLTGIPPNPANAEDRYFLVLFSSQRIPRNPNYSHTFATFVRVGDGGDVQEQTISWLPERMPVRIQAVLPERGRNYGLHETIRLALDSGERVSAWGPYEIQPDLYNRATAQIQQLNSGSVRYKAFDGFRSSERVSNCIHAVSSISQGDRVRVLSPGWGDTASYFVLGSLLPWIVDRHETHDGIAKSLGLEAYPIAYRKTFDSPAIPSMTGLPLFLRDGRPVPTYGVPAVRGRTRR